MDIRSLALTVLAISALILMLRYAQDVFVPIVVSALTFYALDPAVTWLTRLRIPRSIGAALVLAAVVSALGAGIWALQPQAVAVVEQLPEGAQRLRSSLRRTPRNPESALTKVQEAAKEIDKTAAEAVGPSPPPTPGVTRVQIEEPTLRVSQYLWSGSLGAAQIAGQGIMLIFLTYFMLVSSDQFRRKLVKHASATLSQKKVTVQILNDIDAQIRRFLQVQIATSAIVGLVTMVALWWIGLEQAAFWGLLAGLLNSVPYFGPLIVTVFLAAAGYLQFQTIGMAAAVASISLVITSLEGLLLTPILIGRAGKLNHVAVFAALLFWSWLWGILGLLLAMPMLMAMKAVADHVEGLAPIADFLGE